MKKKEFEFLKRMPILIKVVRMKWLESILMGSIYLIIGVITLTILTAIASIIFYFFGYIILGLNAILILIVFIVTGKLIYDKMV